MIAGIAVAVLALVLLVRAVDSTIDLWFRNAPNAAQAIVGSGVDDAAPLDRTSLPIDASVEIGPGDPTSGGDARPSATPRPEGNDGVRFSAVSNFNQGMSEDADIADVPASDSNDQAAPSQVTAAAGIKDASVGAAHEDAAAARSAAKSPSPVTQPVRCGWRTCPEGQQCCNWNCGTCVRPGETCSIFCGAPALPISAPCGPNTCNVAEVCCNASCGICVPSGGTCSKEPCVSMYLPVSPTCGMNTCNVGQVCCNPSCGICTSPGETCSFDPCL